MKYLGWKMNDYLAEVHLKSIRSDFEKNKSYKLSSYKKRYSFISSNLRNLQELF